MQHRILQINMAKRKLSGLILVIGGGAAIIIMGIYNYQKQND